MDFLPDHRAHLQMDDARSVCLCDHGILGAARLVASDAVNVYSTYRVASIVFFCISWNPRDDYFPISVLLAGGAGGRGGPGAWQNDRGSTAGFNGRRVGYGHEGRRDGNVAPNLVMYFIILTTAATLNAQGMKNIETARQAAEALRPLAGKGAYWLFTLGLVGTGMLGVPVLAGSCAYAIAEAARWRGASLNKNVHMAPRFYGVIAVSVLVGLALNYAGLNAVKMLFWSAVLNGILAPPLVVLVVLLTSDKKVMGKRANAPSARVLGWICAAVMSAAALGLLVQ